MKQIIGLDKYDLDTPSLLIDLDTMERNISRMTNYFNGVKADLSPHMKHHKCPTIAHKQLDAGAKGVTCQKLGEAEVMAEAGIKDILLSNEVANESKIRRAVALASHSNLVVGVDNLMNIKALSRHSLDKKMKLGVAMEIYMGRCGVEAGKPALSLAKEIQKCKGLELKGIWCHNGRVGGMKNLVERRKSQIESLEQLIGTRDLLEDSGLNVGIVSAGCTATYNIVGEYPGVTEVQAGSYVFMDRAYKAMEGMEMFDCALTVLATVISRPTHDKVIIDVGLKSIAPESGCGYRNLILPEVIGLKGVEFLGLSEEHGVLRLYQPSRDIKVGDKLELLPCHSCTTVDRYDYYYGIRDGRVEVVWPISARGKSQ